MSGKKIYYIVSLLKIVIKEEVEHFKLLAGILYNVFNFLINVLPEYSVIKSGKISILSFNSAVRTITDGENKTFLLSLFIIIKRSMICRKVPQKVGNNSPVSCVLKPKVKELLCDSDIRFKLCYLKRCLIASAVSELYVLTMMSVIGYLTYYLAWRNAKAD